MLLGVTVSQEERPDVLNEESEVTVQVVTDDNSGVTVPIVCLVRFYADIPVSVKVLRKG